MQTVHSFFNLSAHLVLCLNACIAKVLECSTLLVASGQHVHVF